MYTKKQMIDRAKKVMPGGVNSSIRKMEPFMVWKKADGAYLWDWDDEKYLDLNAGWGPHILGYNRPEVVEAVREAVSGQDQPGIGVTEREIQLAEKIVEHVPCAEKALICNSGSEATFHAIRLSRAVTGRKKVLKFQGCFHGWHDYVLRNCYSALDAVYTRNPNSAGMFDEAVDATLVCRINDIDHVEKTLEENKDQVSCIIIEPIAHNLGCVIPTTEFLKGLRRLCDEHGVILIFDEIITGFRVGLGGYQEVCGVMPDLTTLGKALGSGYQIAAIAGKAQLMDNFNTHPDGDVSFQGTCNGHPSGVAAALATIDVLEKEPVYEYIFALGKYFMDNMQAIFDRNNETATMIGYGSICVPIWAKGPFMNHEDILKGNADRSIQFRLAMIEKGIYMAPAEPKRWTVSYAHTKEDIDRVLQAAEDVVKNMMQ